MARETKKIYEKEFLQEHYPSKMKANGDNAFSIICRDPKSPLGSLILVPGLNFLFSSDSKVHFVYIGYDPTKDWTGALNEIEYYFKDGLFEPLMFFKKNEDSSLDFIGKFCILGKSNDEDTLRQFRKLNSDIKPGYDLKYVVTIIEEDFLKKNREAYPYRGFVMTPSQKEFFSNIHNRLRKK